MRVVLGIGFIVLLSVARNALGQAAEEKEPTLAEAKAEFAKADRALNEAWAIVKKAVTGTPFEELKAEQRDWLHFRDDRAERESAALREEDAKRSPTWHTVAAGLTEARAKWLRARAQAASEPNESLSGEWMDSYGGHMQVLQQPGRLVFAIEVVRGPTYHSGSVAGVATWNERIGWWSDKGREAEKEEESNLAFIERDGCLEVIGAQTGHYHGARAYFDGMFCKTGPLDPKDEAELIKAAESGETPEPEP